MPRFTEYTLEQAQDAVARTLALTPEQYEVNRKFVEHKDHWQDGDGFIGLASVPKSIRTAMLPSIEPQFKPVDTIGEVQDRFVNALLETQADVQFTPIEPTGQDGKPGDEQKKEADDMSRRVSRWWDDVKLWEELRNALSRARWNGRGVIRKYIPRDQLAQQTVTGTTDTGEQVQNTVTVLPTGLGFDEALRRIRVASEQSNAAAVVTDPDALETVAIFLFRDNTDADGNGGTDAAEIWTVARSDAGAPTLLMRILRPGIDDKGKASNAIQNAEEFAFPGVDRLPLAEMTADVLITPVVVQQQKALNYQESVVVRTTEAAGFRERYLINAAPDLIWTPTKAADTQYVETRIEGDVTLYGYPRPRTLGAGVMTEPRGFAYDTNEQGGKGITTPSVTALDPVDPAFAIAGCEHVRAGILNDCHQAHVLGAENLQRSGISIVQARADFSRDLTRCKSPLEMLIAETIIGAIATALQMSNEFAGFLERFRVVVSVHPNAGPLTPDERAANLADVNGGLLSDETAMAANGIEDIDAERARIAASPMGSLALSIKQAQTVTAWLAAGAALPFAAKKAGLSVEDAAELALGITASDGVTQ